MLCIVVSNTTHLSATITDHHCMSLFNCHKTKTVDKAVKASHKYHEQQCLTNHQLCVNTSTASHLQEMTMALQRDQSPSVRISEIATNLIVNAGL